MRKYFLLIVTCFLFLNFTGFAQSKFVIAGNSGSSAIDCNDSTFLRILNGRVIDANCQVTAFERIQIVRTQNGLNELGIQSNKPIMLLTLKSLPVKEKIDSALFNQPAFVKLFKFPLSLELPVSLNGKLLTIEEETELFKNITFGEIKHLKYVGPENNKNAPFGVINITI